MKDDLLRNLPWLKSKIKVQVLKNPVNLNEIIHEGADRPFAEEYIVAAGRLIKEKGFDVLIKAFAIIKKQNTNLHLIILGDGSEQGTLYNIIKEFHLVGKVHLLGWKENVYSYFSHANGCVVSSRVEGFPNVLLQMMANNNCVISTTCAGGIAEIPGLYICEPGNIEKLARMISCALENSNHDKKEIFESFLKNNSVESYVEVIESIIESSISDS